MSDISALKWGENKLKLGEALILFPEGTRSKSGKLMKGKSGVARLATLTETPIVPIGISGSENYHCNFFSFLWRKKLNCFHII